MLWLIVSRPRWSSFPGENAKAHDINRMRSSGGRADCIGKISSIVIEGLNLGQSVTALETPVKDRSKSIDSQLSREGDSSSTPLQWRPLWIRLAISNDLTCPAGAGFGDRARFLEQELRVYRFDRSSEPFETRS